MRLHRVLPEPGWVNRAHSGVWLSHSLPAWPPQLTQVLFWLLSLSLFYIFTWFPQLRHQMWRCWVPEWVQSRLRTPCQTLSQVYYTHDPHSFPTITLQGRWNDTHFGGGNSSLDQFLHLPKTAVTELGFKPRSDYGAVCIEHYAVE